MYRTSFICFLENFHIQMVSFDTSLQFCAGNNLGQDACSGDSGKLNFSYFAYTTVIVIHVKSLLWLVKTVY